MELEDWSELAGLTARAPEKTKKQTTTRKKKNTDAPVEVKKRGRDGSNDVVEFLKEPTEAGELSETHSFRAYQVKDNKMDLFNTALERGHRAASDVIPQVVTHNASSQIPLYTSMPWYKEYRAVMSHDTSMKLQKQELYRRAELHDFLRAPDPTLEGLERPCFNLDRPVGTHEMDVQCIAHHLSEERGANLGKRGFRLRELLPMSLEKTIRKKLKEGAPKDTLIKLLPPIRELCYLCHIFQATQDAIKIKYDEDARLQKDMVNQPQPEKNIYRIVNKIAVWVGTPGEYNQNVMLVSTNPAFGVFRPIPLFNQNNYEVLFPGDNNNPDKVGRIQESVNMLF
jgi:hypothetical protein